MEIENMPLVSVVIATYNRVHTLPASINSVLNQTWKNLEVLIIDDGSEDGTEEYVKGIRDSRVKYWKMETNRGASAARNKGAALAKGEFLAFQDSDDEWMPHKLEKQMERMGSDETLSMVYCEYGVYENGTFLGIVPDRALSYEEKDGDLFSCLLLHSLIGTPTLVVRREEFLKAGGFNETLKCGEDYEFTLRFSRTHRIGFLQEVLLKVNSLPGSVNKRLEEGVHTQFYVIREMLEPLREKKLLDDKFLDVFETAELYRCYDIFTEEMTELKGELTPGEEQENAEMYLKKAEECKRIYTKKVDLYKDILKSKQDMLQMYLMLYEKKVQWSDESEQAGMEILENLDMLPDFFVIPEEIWESRDTLKKKLENLGLHNQQELNQLFWLTDAVNLLELLEKHLLRQL